MVFEFSIFVVKFCNFDHSASVGVFHQKTFGDLHTVSTLRPGIKAVHLSYQFPSKYSQQPPPHKKVLSITPLQFN